MRDFVDEFLDQFDMAVYRALSNLEINSGNDPSVRPPGFPTRDIGYALDPDLRGKLGTESMQALTDRALHRMERIGSVKSLTSHYGNIWKTVQILDSLAMLPRPHHAD